ncbi:sulfatase/phosphatase domain-containing protein [Dactylosporangium sp. CA-152071]|uniref:sulfatase/phosphatase domain-containing protein n=1 Tax=Dactylosporangium sp. CA-152071 TaxID=3239933 RepID=UPI003D8A7690
MAAWAVAVVAAAGPVAPTHDVRAAAPPGRPNVLLLPMDDARTGQTFAMPKALAWLSDNGKLFGEHGLPEKFMPYLQAERVPLPISWPGHIPAGSDRRLAANLDITPTVLAAAGLTPSFQVDGRDLLAPGDRRALLTEYWRDPANGAGIPSWASTVVPGRYRYTEIYDDAFTVTDREYYDLARDPWQLTNPLQDGSTRPALAAALARQRTCTGRDCP